MRNGERASTERNPQSERMLESIRTRKRVEHDAEELQWHSSLKGKRKLIASKGKTRQSYAQDRPTTLMSLKSNLGFCETASPPALYVKLYDSEDR